MAKKQAVKKHTVAKVVKATKKVAKHANDWAKDVSKQITELAETPKTSMRKFRVLNGVTIGSKSWEPNSERAIIRDDELTEEQREKLLESRTIEEVFE